MNSLYLPTLNVSSADESVLVMEDGNQFNVGSIEVHEILKMLDQGGEVLTHSFERRAKSGDIITKQYSFDRSHVESFVVDRVVGDLDLLKLSRLDVMRALSSK